MSGAEHMEEDTYTIQEVCDDASRNLAGCDNDDTCCTFPKGYVARQALYRCMTCESISGKQGGVCFPCSIHCHKDHILEDLYTKRNFRCDCGNSRFPSNFMCTLWEEKDDLNVSNQYNDNFSGLYCVCKGKYEEDMDPEEMIQCIICEDWYHLKHLCNSPNELRSIDYSFEEFICKLCLANREYLRIYDQANVNKLLKQSVIQESSPCRMIVLKTSIENLAAPLVGFSCGAFLLADWRQYLCLCHSCMDLMKQHGTAFLINPQDTMATYCQSFDDDDDETELKEALTDLPFTTAIKLAEGIAYLKDEFSNFMASLDPSKVVTVEDISNFTDKLKRRHPDGQE